jgi:hypothetical protein
MSTQKCLLISDFSSEGSSCFSCSIVGRNWNVFWAISRQSVEPWDLFLEVTVRFRQSVEPWDFFWTFDFEGGHASRASPEIFLGSLILEELLFHFGNKLNG